MNAPTTPEPRPDQRSYGTELDAELRRLHDSVADRAHRSPSARLMLGAEILATLRRIREICTP